MPSTSRGGQGATPTKAEKKNRKPGGAPSAPPSKRMRVGLASASSASPEEEDLGSEAIQAKLREAEADVEEVKEETRAVRWGYLVRRALLANRDAKVRANRAKLRGALAAALKRERHRTAILQCGLPTPIWAVQGRERDCSGEGDPGEGQGSARVPWSGVGWDPRAYEGRSPPVFTMSWYRWAWVNVCLEDKDYMHHLMALACFQGHRAAIKWFRTECGFKWSCGSCESSVAGFAALGGHLKLKTVGCPLDTNTCAGAAEGGHLEILEWLREKDGRSKSKNAMPRCPWSESTCTEAAAGGHLNILKWARKNGCPWDDGTCTEASRNCHLNIPKWIKTTGNKNRMWFDDKDGKWKDLKERRDLDSFYSHYDPVEGIWDLPLEYDCEETAAQLWDSFRSYPAGKGSIEILELFKEEGMWFDILTMCFAARGGQLETMKWLVANTRCSYDNLSTTLEFAARGGHLDCFKHLVKKGARYSDRAEEVACQCGHLNILKWMRSHDCSWCTADFLQPSSLMTLVCTSKPLYHYPVLKLAKWIVEDLKCNLKKECTSVFPPRQGYAAMAASTGNFGLLKYLVQVGCPYVYDSVLKEAKYLNDSRYQYHRKSKARKLRDQALLSWVEDNMTR